MLFKKECRLPLDIALVPPENLPSEAAECMDQILTGLQETQTAVKQNVEEAKRRYKQQHDKNAKPHSFAIGQRVWLHYFAKKKGVSAKLTRKWVGPFYIVHVVKGGSFMLRRCSDNVILKSPVHPVRLKPFWDPNDRPTNHVPINEDYVTDDAISSDNESDVGNELSSDNEAHVDNEPAKSAVNEHRDKEPPDKQEVLPQTYQVQRILASKKIGSTKFYKIKWIGFRETTWEPANHIPEELQRHFHTTCTAKGRKRKKKT